MDPHGASVNCERCGSEMHTSVGSKYSDWMSKIRSDDEELHCSDCRSELADPEERHINIEIDHTSDGVVFTVKLVNPTEESVGFSLGDPMFEDEEQWADTDAWTEAAQDDKGNVGHLAVANEDGDIVFEHEFKAFFSRDVLDSQMLVGSERTREFEVTWKDTGEKDAQDVDMDYNRYVSDPDTKPTDHSSLTAVFMLKANPRNDWEYKRASEYLHI